MKKWINCKNCSERYSSELKKCPFCDTRTPLCLWKKCVLILIILILVVVCGKIVFSMIEKVYKKPPKEEQTHLYTESTESEDVVQDEPDANGDTDDQNKSETEKNDSKAPATKVENDESKSQEQKSENQIPQDEVKGVKTEDIVLPDFFDAAEGLNHCKEYAPLSYVVLLSCMNKAVSGYNSQFDGEYLLEVGGNTDRIMIYTYRMRFDFADVNGAKAKCEKYLDNNTDFIQSQLTLYKKTMPEIKGIMVIFEHDDSNLTLTSRTFK